MIFSSVSAKIVCFAACLHGQDYPPALTCFSAPSRIARPVPEMMVQTSSRFFVAVVVHAVARVEGDFDGHAFILNVQHAEEPQDFSANIICWWMLST